MAQSIKSNLPAIEANGIYAVKPNKGRKGKVTATVEGVFQLLPFSTRCTPRMTRAMYLP